MEFKWEMDRNIFVHIYYAQMNEQTFQVYFRQFGQYSFWYVQHLLLVPFLIQADFPGLRFWSVNSGGK